MDKKKMYILIAVLAVILVACLVLVIALKGGSTDVKDPDTTQSVGTGETEGTGEETPESTGTNGNGGTGNGGTGNGGTGNGGTGNGGTGNGGTGNGSDVEVSIDLGLEPDDFDTSSSSGGNSSSTPTDGAETPNNVIRFPDLVQAGQSGK